MKKTFYIIILFAFSKQIFGQINSKKAYIKTINLKTDSAYSNVKVKLQSKNSSLEFVNKTPISNISFYRNKLCTLIVKINDFQLIIPNFNKYFSDAGMAFSVDVTIHKHLSTCTSVFTFDGGNELAESVNCNSGEKTNSQTVYITTTDKINSTEGYYSFLKP